LVIESSEGIILAGAVVFLLEVLRARARNDWVLTGIFFEHRLVIFQNVKWMSLGLETKKATIRQPFKRNVRSINRNPE
jgi:hypothetical protein